MKITFCMFQVITGGIEKSLIRLLRELLKSYGYKFTIVVQKPIEEEIFINFFKENKIDVYTVEDVENSIHVKKEGFLSKIIRRFLRVIYRRRKASIIKKCFLKSDLIVDYFNCSFCDLLKNINVPKIGWYHSGFLQYEKHFDLLTKKYAKTYDKFVVITKSFRNNLVNDRHIGDKVVQIYNPFDIDKIRDIASRTTDYPKEERYFTFVGRFHKDKDHKTVIEAFEVIARKYPDVKIYFIGDGDTKSYNERIVKTKKLEKNIVFLGSLENPFGYVQHAVANILSSPSEGLSNVLIEAAILGTINIASDCPSGPSEVLLNGKAGLLYPVGDSVKLSQIMEDVLEERINKKELIENANNGIDRFNTKKITEEFVKLCNQTVNSQKSIGIVNFAFENENYGAVLTAYALNRYLSNLGYLVKNINYTAKFYKERNVKDSSNFEEFKRMYLPMTREYNLAELADANNDFDIFIVGSDQVFRHSFVQGEKGVYYLSFVRKGRKKIAYAASFGISNFDGDKRDKNKVKALLKSFDAISVREFDGIGILTRDFGIDGTLVLDPVFMIDWNSLLIDFKYDDTIYYILRPELRYLAVKNMFGSHLTIDEWLSAIKNAKLVLTDSFHCICFCILFKKKFVPLAHQNSPTSRIYSLFDMLSIPREKIIFDNTDMNKIDLEKYIVDPVNISNLYDRLAKWQQLSETFITNAIGDKNVHGR